MKCINYLGLALYGWLFSLTLTGQEPSSAITYNLNGGRFGDHLIIYIKAKWLAYKYQIPLLYRPFRYSEYLKLHDLEEIYIRDKHDPQFRVQVLRYGDRVPLNSTQRKCLEKDLNIDRDSATLYWVNFYLKLSDWHRTDQISDEKFINELKRSIAPRVPIAPLRLPKNRLTVAIHVRRGGGYEKPNYNIDPEKGPVFPPLRFPPDQFYIDQLKVISDMFAPQLLYVHIFTDDPEPQKIVDKYSVALNNPRIVFGCRTKNNSHDKNVLEDFFGMSKFDCLIRPESGFSRAAQLIGNHKLVIAPKAFRFEGDQLIITDVKIIHKNEAL